MARKKYPPAYAVTGAGFWPAAGTVPPLEDAPGTYTITQNATDSFTLRLQTPGPFNPAGQEPRVMTGRYVYFPALAGRKMYQVSFVSDPYNAIAPLVGSSCHITFKENPVGLVDGVANDILVVEDAGIPCKVWNNGGAPALVDGSNLAPGQWMKMTVPFEYDSAATTLAITITR